MVTNLGKNLISKINVKPTCNKLLKKKEAFENPQFLGPDSKGSLDQGNIGNCWLAEIHFLKKCLPKKFYLFFFHRFIAGNLTLLIAS